uniref:Uncharacterized protein n=1 Tax=viral metagenome TaxID=1070528 RepID=A0A6C0ITJ7_9ZZZZ
MPISTTTPVYKRSGFAWSTPECLRLQREYQLLELSIDEISKRHQRSPTAIALRLVKEYYAADCQPDIKKYLDNISQKKSKKDNISLRITESSDDDNCSEYVDDEKSDSSSDNESSMWDDDNSTQSTSASEIANLKGQVSDLNGKIDSILEMLRRSNGGSVIGMY